MGSGGVNGVELVATDRLSVKTCARLCEMTVCSAAVWEAVSFKSYQGSVGM